MAAPVDDLVLPARAGGHLRLDGRAVSVRWGPDGDRGRVADRCPRELVAADLPYVSDLDVLRPRWTAGELRVLRAVLDRAVHVLRAALT
ncbi:hypothetical protein SAMN06893096_103392 [Geodermatophilus pulveris]|uniref:Uncharacterized protein n=1 Tax=Geodermatophilus pulveris TaxID=1564159 RepID=A0A239DV90_9ACTN|nr:hypothetical protein [Geodermatophilus pulveris]SNS36515.1 hypothetical protein SAMN06893096_103392 [Geodermatophilus pulveris]